MPSSPLQGDDGIAHARRIALALVVAASLPACSQDTTSVSAGGAGVAPAATNAAVPVRAGTPDLTVTVIASGLDQVWDVGVLPDGRALVTERAGTIVLLSGLRAGATVTRVGADLTDVYARGEGGLMGMVVHPDFATSRLFTTCQTHATAGAPTDIGLVTWRLSDDDRVATRV